MFIILEGCDGAGKSTLAKKLAECLPGATLEHRGPPKQHPLVEYEAAVEWYRPGAGAHVIADRWHWGEPIYGSLYRGGSTLGIPGLRHVSMFLRSRGALTVFVDPPNDVIHERLTVRGDDYVRPGDVDTIIRDYRRLASTMRNCEHVTHVTTGDASSVGLVLHLAAYHETAAAPLAPHPSYVGPVQPGVLFVGERPATGGARPVHQAAFTPYAGTSGWYLLSALPDTWHGSVGFTNVFTDDVPALLRVLKWPIVVALGQTASGALRSRGVPHRTIPHPSYWKRFRHHDKAGYQALICEATGGRTP